MPLDFQNGDLGDAVGVGKVDADAARIWIRAQRPGSHRVHWWREGNREQADVLEVEVSDDVDRDFTCSVLLPGEDGSPLAPQTRYHFRVEREGESHRVGKGKFETAPAGPDDTPERFAFAVMSCNQPFDAQGAVREDARQMLRATVRALEERDCKFVLMIGDQMYTDMPPDLSLFNSDYFATVAPDGRNRIQDCTAAEVRRLYHDRYRHFWNVPELKELMADFPCYMIYDDHDIVDNWGSAAEHHTEKWRSVEEGARWACFDYQASRVMPFTHVLPPSFHFHFDYGHTSVFVMDLRSEREVDGDEGQLFSARQEQEVHAFLHRCRDQKAVFFALSVPPIHLPRVIAATAAHLSPAGEDFSDRWSSLGHIRDRDWFFKTIRDHQRRNPQQRIVLLGGDIHVGCAHEVTWSDGSGHLFQFISSGMTHTASRPIQTGSKLLMKFNRTVGTRDGEAMAQVRLLPKKRGQKNPYAKLNVGIVEVDTAAPDHAAAIRFLLYGHDEGEPVCVYDSDRL